MRKEVLICDICHRQVTSTEHFAFKVKSEAFVNYQNYDTFGADKRKFDICKDCLDTVKKLRDKTGEME